MVYSVQLSGRWCNGVTVCMREETGETVYVWYRAPKDMFWLGFFFFFFLPGGLLDTWQLAIECLETELETAELELTKDTAAMTGGDATVVNVGRGGLFWHVVQRELGLVTHAGRQRLVAGDEAVGLASQLVVSQELAVFDVTQHSASHYVCV